MTHRETMLARIKSGAGKSFQRARDRGRMPNTGVGRTVWCTEPQYETVIAAIRKIREDENDPKMPEGLALELICADFLAG